MAKAARKWRNSPIVFFFLLFPSTFSSSSSSVFFFPFGDYITFKGKRNARMKRVLREEYDARAESDDDDLYGMTEEERMAREPATLENILEIQITRNKMAHWCHQPFFDEAMVGCFVRVGVGLHEGQQTYRCARIVEVQNTQRVGCPR